MASRSTGWNTSATSSTRDGDVMPHVIVKLWPGKSDEQKRRLAQAITDDVMSFLSCGEPSVSVAFEEVSADQWADKVYRPDIMNKPETIYKKPGYEM